MDDNQDYLNILRKIKAKPKSNQRQLARNLGFSLGKLNYCLNELKKKGFVKFMDKAIMPESFIKIPSKVETLYEIWHGKIINDIRKEHINNNINNVEICKKCAFKETYKWEKLNI